MAKMTLTRLIVPLVLCGAASFAYGQAVYKCQLQGKTTYSNEPCLGAQVVETAPAQRLNESSGNSRNGNDGLRREKREKREKRDKDQAQPECSALDTQEKQQASVIHNSRNIDEVNAATDAFIANRKRYRELGCQ